MCNKFKIKTDNKWKHFKYFYEVPKKVLDIDFDYMDIDDKIDGFICYRKRWYHVSDFMRTDIRGWDGYAGDSFFSGVVIKISNDGESYKIGTYLS